MEPIYFNDGVIKAWDNDDNWVVIEWRTPGHSKICAVKDVRSIEEDIKAKGYKGWIMGSEKEHTDMHPIIEKLGGNKYAEDKTHYFYLKVVN